MPINELIPMDPEYEYSGDLSLVPVRRKVQIPLAPEAWQNELAVPGFARTMLNDLWLAFTGPGNALAGQYTPEELEQVGMRAGGAMTWGGGLATRPENAMGIGGWFTKKPVAKSAPAAAAAAPGFQNPELNKLSNELKELNSTAYSNFSKKGYTMTYHDGDYYVSSTKNPGGLVPPSELPFDLQNLHAQLSQKHHQFNKLKAEEEELAEQFAKQKDDPLLQFNQAYADAQKELQEIHPSLKIEAHPETGDFYATWSDLPISSYDPPVDGVVHSALKKLNKAKADYAYALKPEYEGESVGDILAEAAKKKPPAGSNALGGNKAKEFEQVPFDPLVGAKTFQQAYDAAFGEFYNAGYALHKAGDGYMTVHKIERDAGSDWYKKVDYDNQVPIGSLPDDLSKLFYKVNEFKDKEKIVAAGSKGKLAQKSGVIFGKYSGEPQLEQMPTTAMREYTPKELDWEYETEYGKYAKGLFPDAFASREDFQLKYDRAPLRHLTREELKKLDYSTVNGILESKGSKEEKIKSVMDQIGSRRDVPAIMKAITEGQTAPPIVLRHDKGLRLLAGNTRLLSAAALGKSMPVKVIDLRSYPLKHSDPFNAELPLPPGVGSANFKKWFGDSKVVNEDGNPMIMYHGTNKKFEAFDPSKGKSDRQFVSLSSSPKFSSNWAGETSYNNEPLVYPVFVSAKNPGDFRNPAHVKAAAEWKATEEIAHLKNLKPEQVDKSKDNWKVTYENFFKKGEDGSWVFWEDPKMWKALGWDGAFMLEHGPGISEANPLNIAIPNPSQIKSLFNKGHWSSNDPRMLYAGGVPGLPLGLEPVDHNPFLLEPVTGDPFEPKEKEKK